MILSRPPSNSPNAMARTRGMTLCSSFDNIIYNEEEEESSVIIIPDNYEYDNDNEDNNMFDGQLGDELAAYFLPPPASAASCIVKSPVSPVLTPTSTPTPSSPMEWNNNKDNGRHGNSNNAPESSSSSADAAVSSFLLGRKSKKQTFPETLYRILDDVANGNVGMHLSSSQASKMISWEEMGKGFKIYQPKEFNAMILPIYAKRQTRYRSFQRQLNIYGFKMNKKSGIYHHDYFTRGDILSLKKIRPSPNKNHIKNNCRKSNIKNMITTTTTASSSTSRVAFDAVEQQQRVLGRSIVSSEEEYDSSSSSGCSTTPLLMRKLPSSIFSFSLLPNDTITITGTGTGTGTGYNMMPIIATGSNANADALEDIDVTNISKNIDINTTNAITVFDDLDFLGWR